MGLRQKVVIVGAGIAGLTAAHELIERDFDVVVYERRFHCGGKAASVRVHTANGASADPTDHPGLPAEHGFRFFPGWYRHLPDTMSRIPCRGRRDRARDKNVLDHLVPVDRNLLVQYKRDPIPIVLRPPRNLDQAQALASFFAQVQGMGLSLTDVLVFFQKLAEFLRTPADTRRRQYDAQTWWDFVGADQRTPAFQDLTLASTRTSIAANASEASAYTIASLALRTLFDSSLTLDRVLDGPTSEVWIEPWVRYLMARGVKFVHGYELETIDFYDRKPAISSLEFSCVDDLIEQRYLRALQSLEEDGAKTNHKTASRAPDKLENTYRDLEQWKDDCARARSTSFERSAARATSQQARGLSAVSNRLDQLVIHRLTDKADYYIFALPLEQMAYYVNRSKMMTHYDTSLDGIVWLTGSVDWLAGIQFYLQLPLDVRAGHIICADSEWALTAIEQTQFWRDVQLPDEVQSVLSVDISAWGKKGRVFQKEAFCCTREQIATEVWEQLKASLNRPGEKKILHDDMLITRALSAKSYHLDDSVSDRFDRRKQAAYNRAQAVQFSAPELLSQSAAQPDAPFVFGDRLEMNIEPLLVNRPGALRRRPGVATQVENMFLAADYVDTETNLACMEGANEAARQAVNAVLRFSGSKEEPCRTWRFEDADMLTLVTRALSMAEAIPGVRQSIEVAVDAATLVGALAARAKDTVKQLWKRT